MWARDSPTPPAVPAISKIGVSLAMVHLRWRRSLPAVDHFGVAASGRIRMAEAAHRGNRPRHRLTRRNAPSHHRRRAINHL
ncbi:hypothetical protein [Pseudoxanthomonas wuyuanensis]|uniref:hypothetical protein n=1 Tax=Pseudoxanthomonas wuyuanensis TaxID=1073196 RepID=UPI00114507C7|nr:hypothetical protein [Pseudoxanthomonas wuyuanensis]